MPSSLPFVSVIIPCYNERDFIEDLFESVLHQDYPKDRFEVIVVDGGSQDGTREIILRAVKADPRVRLLDNPGRSKPRALNLGIGKARGEIIVRLDAHATYPPEYLRLCVQHLLESGADNVGGYRLTRARETTLWGRAVALSIRSRFGSGGAVYRTGAVRPRWVDTVFGGCYRRQLFDRLGLFDERLDRGQDREFNERLVRSGGRILFVPDIRCVYYARSGISDFVRWVFVSGMTPFYISRVVGYRVWSLRNVVPPLFVLALIGLPVVAVVAPLALELWLGAVGIYLAATVSAAVYEAVRARQLRLLPFLVLVFAVTHVAYGLGAVWGLLRPVISGRRWAGT